MHRGYFRVQVFFALHGKFGPKIFINLVPSSPRGVGFPYDFDLEGVTFLFPFGFAKDNVNFLVDGLRKIC